MSAEILQEGLGGVVTIEITGVASTANAGQGQIENDFGADVRILQAWLLVDTPSTGAATVNVGVADAGGTANDILSAFALNGLTADSLHNCFAMQNTAETEVTAPAKWTEAKVVSITASATLAGFHGYLILRVIRDPRA